MVAHLGEGAYAILDEFAITLAEMQDMGPPPLLTRITEAGDNDPVETYGVLHKGKATYRPNDALGFDTIDEMLRNGQVQFGMAMKESWLLSVFRNDRSYKIECKDEKLASIVQGIMKRVLMRHASDFTKAMPYGAAFFEKIWDYLPAVQWGIEGIPDGEKVYGYKSVDAIHPKSIDRILYTPDGKHYAGFVQKPQHGGEIAVPAERSLTLTYDKRFRNLWGIPMLEPTYVFWFWYEVALRSFLRYLERMGTPVAVCEAPSRGQVRKPDGTLWRTMKYAMLMAGNVAKSNAIALPSDVDPDTGQKLWNLSYLSADQRGAQFVEAIEMLGTLIIRSVVIGDRAVTQGSEVGSYAAANKHFQVTMLHNEHILTQFLNQFNSYLIPQLAQYNVGANAPPALMVTEGLDPDEKDRLFTLLNTMGNQADTSAMEHIDWIRIFEVENIPVLSEEDVEKLREDKLAREEERMTMQQKFAAKPEEKAPFGKKAESPKDKAKEKVKASADWALYNLAQGQRVPLVLSSEQAMDIVERYKERPFAVALEEQGLTKSELNAVKKELLAQLGLGDADEETKDAVWLLVLREVLSDSSNILEMPESGVILLEEYAASIGLSIGDWLKEVWGKAKSLFKKVVKSVTGKIFKSGDERWRESIAGAHERAARKGGRGDAVITKDGRIWRESDHPRDEEGKFMRKGEDEREETPRTEEEPLAKPSLVLKTDTFAGIEYIGDVPEHVKSGVETLVSDLLQDDYLKDVSGEMVVGSFVEIRRQDPMLAILDELRDLPPAFVHPATGKVYYFTDRLAEHGENYATHVLVHELVHRVSNDDRGLLKSLYNESRTIEEATTDLITMRTAKKYAADYEPWIGYDEDANALVRLLYVKNNGNAEAVWQDVYDIHRGGSSRDEIAKMINGSFTKKLTIPQQVFVRNYLKLDKPYGDNNGIDLAVRYVLANEHGSGTDAYFVALADYMGGADWEWLRENINE